VWLWRVLFLGCSEINHLLEADGSVDMLATNLVRCETIFGWLVTTPTPRNQGNFTSNSPSRPP
jgi:hypothetical protein